MSDYSDVDDLVAPYFSSWVNGQGQPVHETYEGLHAVQRDRQSWRKQRDKERRIARKVRRSSAVAAAQEPHDEQPDLDFDAYVERTVAQNRHFSMTSAVAGDMFSKDKKSLGTNSPVGAVQSNVSPATAMRRGHTAIEQIIDEFDRRYHERLGALKSSQAARSWVQAGQRLASEQQRSVQKHIERVGRATANRKKTRDSEILSTKPDSRAANTQNGPLSPTESAAVAKHIARQKAGREKARLKQQQRSGAHRQRKTLTRAFDVFNSASPSTRTPPPAAVSMVHFSSSRHFRPEVAWAPDVQDYDVEVPTYPDSVIDDIGAMSEDSMDNIIDSGLPAGSGQPVVSQQELTTPQQDLTPPQNRHNPHTLLSPELIALGEEVETLRRAADYARRRDEAEIEAAEAEMLRRQQRRVHELYRQQKEQTQELLMHQEALRVLEREQAEFRHRQDELLSTSRSSQTPDDFSASSLHQPRNDRPSANDDQATLGDHHADTTHRTPALQEQANAAETSSTTPQVEINEKNDSSSDSGGDVVDSVSPPCEPDRHVETPGTSPDRPTKVVVHNPQLAALLVTDDAEADTLDQDDHPRTPFNEPAVTTLPADSSANTASDFEENGDAVAANTGDDHEHARLVPTNDGDNVDTTPDPQESALVARTSPAVSAVMAHYQAAYESSVAHARELQKENQKLWELLQKTQQSSPDAAASPSSSPPSPKKLQAEVDHYKAVRSASTLSFNRCFMSLIHDVAVPAGLRQLDCAHG